MRKTVTVLFTDVVESTPLGERLDPESLRTVMIRFFEAMKAVVERHGGTVAQFSGDALLAVFGIPAAHEDDALRAVRAAYEMRSALQELNAALQRDQGVLVEARTGINTGEVLAGDPLAGQAIVVGDAVNVGARLEEAASAGEILVGEATQQLVKDAVDLEQLAPLTLKGKADAVRAARMLGVRSPVDRSSRFDSPLIGRERETSLLREAFERSVEERIPLLVTVIGQAGVGKSRLVDELDSSVRDRALVLGGRCLPYGEGITFWPLVEVVQQAASLTADETPEEARARIAALLYGEDAAVVCDIICQLLGLTDVTSPAQQIFWAARKLFESLARRTPLVVVFDDIHWAEPKFLDLVEHITDWTKDASLLVICMAREDLIEKRSTWGGGKLNATSFLLTPLSERDCEALLGNLLGQNELEPIIRERILGAADGNPLFLEEMTSMLIDSGLLARKDGRWVATGDLDSIAVPPNIQALLAARLDGLNGQERRLIGMAAVMGKVFSTRALIDLLPAEHRSGVGDLLLTLARKELLRRDDATFAGQEMFRFRHILIRDAAYESLPKELRAEIHEAYGQWLSSILGERDREYEEIIAYHFEQAHRWLVDLGRSPSDSLTQTAFERLVAAGERAYERADFSASLNFFTRASSLYSGDYRRVAMMLPRLGDALREAGRFEESDAVYAKTIEQAEQADDPMTQTHARLGKATLRFYTDPSGSTDDARRRAEEAIDFFRTVGDSSGLATAWHIVGYINSVRGQITESEPAFRKAIEFARKTGQPFRESVSRRSLLTFMGLGTAPTTAIIEEAQENIRWARQVSDRFLEARALGALGFAKGLQEEFDEALDLLRTYRTIIEDLGNNLETAWTAFHIAEVHRVAGNLEDAEGILRESHELLVRLGDRGVRSTIAAQLADVLYLRGRLDEADRYTLVSEETAAPDDLLSQIHWRRTRARTRVRLGDLEQAEILARHAVKLAQRTDFLMTHAEAVADLAEVLYVAGDRAAATTELRRSLELHDQKGNLAGAKFTRTRLEHLLD